VCNLTNSRREINPRFLAIYEEAAVNWRRLKIFIFVGRHVGPRGAGVYELFLVRTLNHLFGSSRKFALP
jgi:hypothetical protein